MRDWKKLRVFDAADALVMAIYESSARWPSDQKFSLTQQIQRAAVSVSSNIVEGCARSSVREYVRFLEVAYASSCEVQYQLSIARRLNFSSDMHSLEESAIALSRGLGAMVAKAQSLEPKA
jgi:four helix bundle protein